MRFEHNAVEPVLFEAMGDLRVTNPRNMGIQHDGTIPTHENFRDCNITKAKKACVLGTAWFLNHEIENRPSCLIEGKPASVDEGIERAAQILARSRYPLIYGLSDTTVSYTHLRAHET